MGTELLGKCRVHVVRYTHNGKIRIHGQELAAKTRLLRSFLGENDSVSFCPACFLEDSHRSTAISYELHINLLFNESPNRVWNHHWMVS